MSVRARKRLTTVVSKAAAYDTILRPIITEKATIANENGEFFINGLCSKRNTLIISCHGYCDSVCQHNHQHGKG